MLVTKNDFLWALVFLVPALSVAGEGDQVGREFGYCKVYTEEHEKQALYSTVFQADFVDFYGSYMSDKTREIERRFQRYAYAYHGVEGDASCVRRKTFLEAEDKQLNDMSEMRSEGGWQVSVVRWRAQNSRRGEQE